MSLLIQQIDEYEDQYLSKINISALKKILYQTGIFYTNCSDQSNSLQIKFFKIIDLFKTYSVQLQFIIKQDCVKFTSSLLTQSSPFLIQDKKIKLIFQRLLQKYFTKNQTIIHLSSSGQFITKKILSYPKIKQISRILMIQQQSLCWIRIFLKDFIEDSILFYKMLISKMQGNYKVTCKLKPQYFYKQIKCSNICNNSFLPTFDMYKKNQFAFQLLQTRKNAKILKFQINLRQINFIYYQNPSNLLQKKQLNKELSSDFNLRQIYDELMSFKKKKNQQFHSEQMKQTLSKLSLNWKIFVSNLQINFCKKDGSFKDQIYNEIEILNPQKIIWQNFQSTSISHLKIGKIKYINKTILQKSSQKSSSEEQNIFGLPQSYQSTLVLKHQPLKPLQSNEKNRAQGQIKWEKTIIKQCFKNQACYYIPNFFYTEQNLLNFSQKGRQIQFLLSQFIKKGTLRNWLCDGEDFLSIFSKINVIIHILYGLIFIHSKKLLHMDLKPINILMDKNFIPKITDFGSAYNKDVYQMLRKQKIQYFLSFSIPYTAPQIFMKQKKPSLNSKCDIFSMGFIIFEILFGCFPLVQSNIKLQKIYKQIGKILQKKQMNLSKDSKSLFDEELETASEYLLNKIYFCPQNFQSDKSQNTLLLVNLIFRCLSCYQQKRPNLGFLVIGVKQIYQLFLQYYSW